MVGFIVERNVDLQSKGKRYGALFMFGIFIIAQVVGSLFACVVSPYIAVGAEPVIFGYLASILAMFAVNWSAMG